MQTAESYFEEQQNHEQAKNWARNSPGAMRLECEIYRMLQKDISRSEHALLIMGLVLANRDWIQNVDFALPEEKVPLQPPNDTLKS